MHILSVVLVHRKTADIKDGPVLVLMLDNTATLLRNQAPTPLIVRKFNSKNVTVHVYKNMKM